MKRPIIYWDEVRAAMKRSKYGRATVSDQILFDSAWRANPVRYRELHAEVGREVLDEVAMVVPPPVLKEKP